MNNTKLIRRWINALRSGVYGSSVGKLRSGSNNYDVLGVLCDVCSRLGYSSWKYDPISEEYSIENEKYRLPDSIKNMVGLSDDFIDRLIVYNDMHMSHNDISYYLERRLLNA